MIQKPERKPNGYRIFTNIHIDQFHLAKIGLETIVLQSGLRKRIIEAIKLSACWKFDDAIQCTKEYIAITDKEKEHAKEAVKIVNELLENKNSNMIVELNLKRSEAAKELGVTIDTIRNWEMNGLIKVKRKENGYRVYDQETMNKLKIIRSLRCANYSLAAILRMMNALGSIGGSSDIDTINILNTPGEEEDIISACDHLMDSLEEAKINAIKVLKLLVHMKGAYSKSE